MQTLHEPFGFLLTLQKRLETLGYKKDTPLHIIMEGLEIG